MQTEEMRRQFIEGMVAAMRVLESRLGLEEVSIYQKFKPDGREDIRDEMLQVEKRLLEIADLCKAQRRGREFI